ncbi:hypothetical protein [Corynebacterium sp.]|uniref:hypothetical protein n=1 Tax=Corynebacterium sp. TaxID=1720 RepID=UPI00199FFE97|nr:hypothetical protein [Corynebacterium sp.]HHU68648.1 hypothetical protein [Corynebacterium sp.]
MTSFRVEAPIIGWDGERIEGTLFFEYKDGEYIVGKMFEFTLDQQNAGRFPYPPDSPTPVELNARESPWHWYQAGLYYCRRMGDPNPEITGTVPEMPEDMEYMFEMDFGWDKPIPAPDLPEDVVQLLPARQV